MRRSLPVALLLLHACGTTPSADGSRRPSTRPAERSAAADVDRDASPSAPALNEDVADAELARAAQLLGCDEAGTTAPVCRELAAFRSGSTPDLRPGTSEGVVLPLAPGLPAAVALLAVRSAGSALEVSWAIVRPNDPTDASRMAAIAADLIAGRPSTTSIGLPPTLAWSRPQRTTGSSLRLEGDTRIFLRRTPNATIALVPGAAAPLLAVHRAGAAGARQ